VEPTELFRVSLVGCVRSGFAFPCMFLLSGVDREVRMIMTTALGGISSGIIKDGREVPNIILVSDVLPATSHELHILYLWHKALIWNTFTFLSVICFTAFAGCGSMIVNDDSEGTWQKQLSRYTFRIRQEELRKIIFTDTFKTYHRAPARRSRKSNMKFTLLGPLKLCFPSSGIPRLPWYCDIRNKQRDTGHCYATASLMRNSAGAIARQRSALNGGSTVGGCVFYVVRSEAISLDRHSCSSRESQGAWCQDKQLAVNRQS
jgi:hypothetical protein